MPDSLTSLSLLQRVRSRDQEAWQRLLYLYVPLVQHWCRSWGVQGADADDIQQDVFLAVSLGLDAFHRDRPGDTFRGWLRVITQRKYLDHCRRSKRRPATQTDADVPLQQVPAPAAEPAPEEESPEEVRRLHHRALELVRGEFEERTWHAFWKCAVEGHAPGDVGLEMSMTPAAVRKAKSRVLRRLREELGELLG